MATVTVSRRLRPLRLAFLVRPTDRAALVRIIEKRRSNYQLGWSSLLEDEDDGYRLLALGGDGAVRGRRRE